MTAEGRPVFCAHADRNGEGAHWLAPNEVCPDVAADIQPSVN